MDDEHFFVDLVTSHFEKSWERVTAASGSIVQVDAELVRLAWSKYTTGVQTFAVALPSRNPDHYKRSGALLHSLYEAAPIVKVRWDEEVERLRNDENVGVSYADAEHWNSFVDWYENYANSIMAFDLSFRCCQVYEPPGRSYDKDFLDSMCYFMAENTNLPVGCFTVIFKAFMT